MINPSNPFREAIKEALLRSEAQGINLTEEQVQRAVQKSLDLASEAVIESLRERKPDMLKEHASLRKGFQSRLEKAWKKPLSTYETCLVIAQELGSTFNEQYRPQASKDHNLVFEVITRLHARTCHLASEIMHLMRGGYASAAMSRWRTMHEVVVIMHFVAQHDNDLAERYLLHEHVEGAKAAREYIEYLGPGQAISQDMLDDNEKKYDDLLKRFGKEYVRDYGWAQEKLPKTVTPSIKAIENAVDLQILRPTYRLASHSVHANPKGILFNLEQGKKPPILLTGPANSGLADPGINAMQHLVSATSVLLGLFPDETTVIGLSALSSFAEEGRAEFLVVHRKIEAYKK